MWSESANPTSAVILDFARYLETQQYRPGAALAPRLPDYAFLLDYRLRQQIAAIGPLRSVTQMVVSSTAALDRQTHLMNGIVVGPQQFPELHAINEACARRLSIATPKLIILPSTLLHAYTITTESASSMIVLSSALVQALEPAELTFIIGHEGGHIQNGHGVYHSALVMLTNPLARSALQTLAAIGGVIDSVKFVTAAIQGGVRLALVRWNRAATITCDRAGLLCCGGLEPAQYALLRQVTGGVESLKQINVDAYLAQHEAIPPSTSSRLLEFAQMNVPLPKRIEALRLFAAAWAEDAGRPGEGDSGGRVIIHNKEALDRQCEQILGIG